MKTSILKRLGKDTKAESSLVCSLLLIVVTVAAAALIYPWIISMIRFQISGARLSVPMVPEQYKIVAGQSTKGREDIGPAMAQPSPLLTGHSSAAPMNFKPEPIGLF